MNAILKDQSILKYQDHAFAFNEVQNLDNILEKTIENLKILRTHLSETKVKQKSTVYYQRPNFNKHYLFFRT